METAPKFKLIRQSVAYASPGFPDSHASLLEAPRRWPAIKKRDVVVALASGFSLTDEEQRRNIFSLVSLPVEGDNLRKIGYDLIRQR